MWGNRWAIALALLMLFSVFAAAGPANAKPNRGFSLPWYAVEVAPGVHWFASAIKTVNNQRVIVDAYAVYHHKPGHDQGGGGGPGGGGETGPLCYGFLAKDARWKTTEPYVLDSTNSHGLTPLFVEDTIQASFDRWDDLVAFDVFGPLDTTSLVDGADTVLPDNKNEVFFGTIDDGSAIAVTIVWGIFRGPPSGRELIEFDLIFDDADYTWGDAIINPAVMDLENIAVHEIGHAGGLADIYDSACADVTMYGFATEGETKKRSLETADVTGFTTLYA